MNFWLEVSGIIGWLMLVVGLILIISVILRAYNAPNQVKYKDLALFLVYTVLVSISLFLILLSWGLLL